MRRHQSEEESAGQQELPASARVSSEPAREPQDAAAVGPVGERAPRVCLGDLGKRP